MIVENHLSYLEKNNARELKLQNTIKRSEKQTIYKLFNYLSSQFDNLSLSWFCTEDQICPMSWLYSVQCSQWMIYRSSHPRCSIKKSILNSGLRSTILLKKRLQHMYFPVNFTTFLRTPHCMKCVQIWSFFWSVFSYFAEHL